jgi:protein-disulfide isomerase
VTSRSEHAAHAADWWSRLSSGLVLACTLVLTGIVVKREFWPPQPDGASARVVKLDPDVWEALAGGRHAIGIPGAPVTIVAFADFQCPFCRDFARETVMPILSKYEDNLVFVFRHLPIPGHRFAYAAARATECAAAQSRFWPMHDALFARQDSIGVRAFSLYARDAGVNTAAFDECMAETAPHDDIESDREFAATIGATGTPVVIVNGQKWIEPPDFRTLDSLVTSLLVKQR